MNTLVPLLIFLVLISLVFFQDANAQNGTLTLNGTLTISQESKPSSPFDPFVAPVTAVIVSAAGVIITNLANRWAKKREEQVEMAKFRMEQITSHLGDYNHYLQTSGWLANKLEEFESKKPPRIPQNEKDFLLLFYYYIRFLQYAHCTFVSRGGFTIADHEAELVLGGLYNTIISTLTDWKSLDRERVRNLLDADETSKELEIKISLNMDGAQDYYTGFKDWLFDPLNMEKIKISRMALTSSSDVLTFEINYLFEKWYGKSFNPTQDFSEATVSILKKEKIFEYDPVRGICIKTLFEAYNGYYKKLFKSDTPEEKAKDQ